MWLRKGSADSHAAHIGFVADSRKQVDAAYHVALAAGATDNGAPGVRLYYGRIRRDYVGVCERLIALPLRVDSVLACLARRSREDRRVVNEIIDRASIFPAPPGQAS